MLKRYAVLVLGLVLMPLPLRADEHGWEFVQAVGGLTIGTPYLDDYSNNWYLPIESNVSGAQKITVTPTIMNSARVCKEVKVEIQGKDIYLVLDTAPVGTDSDKAACPPALLGHASPSSSQPTISPGKYVVSYRGVHEDSGNVVYGSRYETPVRLGDITIGTKTKK